jgi:hypothetical protein
MIHCKTITCVIKQIEDDTHILNYTVCGKRVNVGYCRSEEHEIPDMNSLPVPTSFSWRFTSVAKVL